MASPPKPSGLPLAGPSHQAQKSSFIPFPADSAATAYTQQPAQHPLQHYQSQHQSPPQQHPHPDYHYYQQYPPHALHRSNSNSSLHSQGGNQQQPNVMLRPRVSPDMPPNVHSLFHPDGTPTKSAAEMATELHLSMRALQSRSRTSSAAGGGKGKSPESSSRARLSSTNSNVSFDSTISAKSNAAAATSAACDRCRRLKTKCERRYEPNKPCARCVKACQECTNDDTLLLPGPPKREQKNLFWDYGVPYKTFRESLREQRRENNSSASSSSAAPDADGGVPGGRRPSALANRPRHSFGGNSGGRSRPGGSQRGPTTPGSILTPPIAANPLQNPYQQQLKQEYDSSSSTYSDDGADSVHSDHQPPLPRSQPQRRMQQAASATPLPMPATNSFGMGMGMAGLGLGGPIPFVQSRLATTMHTPDLAAIHQQQFQQQQQMQFQQQHVKRESFEDAPGDGMAYGYAAQHEAPGPSAASSGSGSWAAPSPDLSVASSAPLAPPPQQRQPEHQPEFATFALFRKRQESTTSSKSGWSSGTGPGTDRLGMPALGYSPSMASVASNSSGSALQHRDSIFHGGQLPTMTQQQQPDWAMVTRESQQTVGGWMLVDEQLEALFAKPSCHALPNEVHLGESFYHRGHASFDPALLSRDGMQEGKAAIPGAGGSLGLFFDESGVVQAPLLNAPPGAPGTMGAGLLERLKQDWSARGPAGTTISIPWERIARAAAASSSSSVAASAVGASGEGAEQPQEDITTKVSLWPDQREFNESDYDELRAEADELLRHPVIPHLVKQHFANTHHVFPFLHAPRLLGSLDALVQRAASMAQSSGSQIDMDTDSQSPQEQQSTASSQQQKSAAADKSPVEIRHAQSVLLMVATVAACVTPTVRVALRQTRGMRSSSAGVSSSIDGSEMDQQGEETEQVVQVATDRLAFRCFQVAYALAQPRQAGYAWDEITLDISRICRLVTLPLAVHPLIDAIVVQACRTISGSSWVLSKLLFLYNTRPAELEEWKRILCDGYTALIHQRLWIDRSFRLPNLASLKLVGHPYDVPGEYRDEGLGGASDRECVHAYKKDLALHVIWERLLDSVLCQQLEIDADADAPDEKIERQAQARELAAQRIYDELQEWAADRWHDEEQAATPPEKRAAVEEGSKKIARTPQEIMSARYWRFVLRARFNSVLDLISASLREVDARKEELERYTLLKSRHEEEHRSELDGEGPPRPDAGDKVAQWVQAMVFYKTEKMSLQD